MNLLRTDEDQRNQSDRYPQSGDTFWRKLLAKLFCSRTYCYNSKFQIIYFKVNIQTLISSNTVYVCYSYWYSTLIMLFPFTFQNISSSDRTPTPPTTFSTQFYYFFSFVDIVVSLCWTLLVYDTMFVLKHVKIRLLYNILK